MEKLAASKSQNVKREIYNSLIQGFASTGAFTIEKIMEAGTKANRNGNAQVDFLASHILGVTQILAKKWEDSNPPA